jgi:hypothetical protein
LVDRAHQLSIEEAGSLVIYATRSCRLHHHASKERTGKKRNLSGVAKPYLPLVGFSVLFVQELSEAA